LAGDDPGSIFSASYVLASSPQEAAPGQLFAQLGQASAVGQRAIQRALELAPVLDRQAVLHLLGSARTDLKALALDVLSFRRTEAAAIESVVPGLLHDPDPVAQAAALRAIRRLPSPGYSAMLRRYLSSAARISGEALEAAAVVGGIDWQLAASWLASEDPATATAQLLLALTRPSGQWTELVRDTADQNRQRGALLALGFSGAVAAVDPILQLMRDPDLAALAGEALSGITGVDLEQAKLTIPTPSPLPDKGESELADLGADLSLPVDAELPVPDPDAAAAWWQGQRASFDAGLRYVEGLPMRGEQTLLSAIAAAPLRRRHALALHLAIHSHGQLQIEPRALSRDQLRYLK
jgi:uncharacterized protein (TIGR02270 family)